MSFPSKIVVNFDGSITKNPGGVAGFGWVISDDQGVELASDSGVVCEGAEATNNVAEWGALLEAIKFIERQNWVGEIEIRGDSQIVIYQLNGLYKCRRESLIPFYKECMQRLENFVWSANWIGREDNKRADHLSRPKT